MKYFCRGCAGEASEEVEFRASPGLTEKKSPALRESSPRKSLFAGMSCHIGHTGREFLEKGMLIPYSIMSFLGSGGPMPGSRFILDDEASKAIHLVLYGAGILLSCYTAWRIACSNYKPEKRTGSMIPFIVFVAIFAGLNILLVLSAE